MNTQEKNILIAILGSISLLVGFDLFTDSKDGAPLWHIAVEGGIGAAALWGIFLTLRSRVELKNQLTREIENFSSFKKEAELWRTESRKYLDGLSQAIDQQLDKWGLTLAEKEVAFLLLKGLSLKEVAEVRSTSEKTARAQSTAIYAKSGLTGRSELSAFFLEDLLLPQRGK